MTETEMAEMICRFLPSDFGASTIGESVVFNFRKFGGITVTWHTPREFLFGNDVRMSFFTWLRNWTAIKDNLWLLNLEGCSSVEEMELKFAVLGKL